MATLAPRAAQIEFGFGRGSGQKIAHGLNARGKSLIDAAGVAVGRVRHVGQARVDDARALIRGLGERGQARVKDLRALSCGVGDDGLVRVERRPDRGLVQVEHCGDLLRVIAHLVFQLRPVRVEAPVEILHRRDDLLLELVDACAERLGDLLDPAGQRRIDVSGDRRQRLRQLVGAFLQRLADFRRFGAHAFGDLATAVTERSGGFKGVAGERFRQRAAALGERVFDPRQQAFERRRDLPKLRPGALVDGLQTGVEQGSRFLVSPAELFVDRAAAVDKGLLDCCKLGAEIGRESLGSIADLHDDVAAAPVDCALEARQALAKRSLDAPRMGRKREIDRVVMGGRGGLELLQSRARFRRQLLRVVCEALVEILAAGLHHHVDRIEMSGDAGVKLVGMGAYAIDDAVPAFAYESIQRFEIFAHALGLMRHSVHETDAALTDDFVEGRDLFAQPVMNDGRRVGRRGRGVARKRREPLVDLSRLRAHFRQGLRR